MRDPDESDEMDQVPRPQAEYDDTVFEVLLEARLDLDVELATPRAGFAISRVIVALDRLHHRHLEALAGPLELSEPEYSSMIETLAAEYEDLGAERSRQLAEDLFPKVLEAYQQRAGWPRLFDMEFARRGIDRVIDGVERQRVLDPVEIGRRLPEKAMGYLQEVIDTYLFGCDTACIVLCRSVFEQVAKEVLIAKGTHTEARLRRERPGATDLVRELVQVGLSFESRRKAEELIRRANEAVHSHQPPERVREQFALDSINDILDIVVELQDAW